MHTALLACCGPAEVQPRLAWEGHHSRQVTRLGASAHCWLLDRCCSLSHGHRLPQNPQVKARGSASQKEGMIPHEHKVPIPSQSPYPGRNKSHPSHILESGYTGQKCGEVACVGATRKSPSTPHHSSWLSPEDLPPQCPCSCPPTLESGTIFHWATLVSLVLSSPVSMLHMGDDGVLSEP